MAIEETIGVIMASAGLPEDKAREVRNLIEQNIVEALGRGETMQINGFGHFIVSRRRARAIFNPRTRQTVIYPATKTILFRPSTALMNALN